jgi:hypothetical protein
MGELVGVIPPPPGVTPDFDYSNPWKFKTDLVIVGVGLSLSTLCLAMRIYTRACLLSKFGWDDGISAFFFFVPATNRASGLLTFLNSVNDYSLGTKDRSDRTTPDANNDVFIKQAFSIGTQVACIRM